jgi:hypothetical protein
MGITDGLQEQDTDFYAQGMEELILSYNKPHNHSLYGNHVKV